jgi:hypothetical protein
VHQDHGGRQRSGAMTDLPLLAVLCEYLAEMRSEVKRRPLYVVQGELQSNVMAHQRRDPQRGVARGPGRVRAAAPPGATPGLTGAPSARRSIVAFRSHSPLLGLAKIAPR